MRDERVAPRLFQKRRGTAIFNGRAQLDCTIRDLSATGARLNFGHPTFLPRTFSLRFDSEDQRVTVVWQRGQYAGVRFQTPIKSMLPQRKTFLAWATRRSG
jgi:hypothetical protein